MPRTNFSQTQSGLSSDPLSTAGVNSAGRYRRWLILLLLINGIFFLSTFRAGHTWGDDFAMYVLHARNLATGQPYTATGYVYNPQEPHVGPPAYPPGFPLLLAPVYKIFGMNFTAFKVVEVISWLLYLLVVYELLEDYLPAPWRMIVIALLGFNPVMWDAKDSVVSDIPGLFFAALAIYGAKHAYSRYAEQRSVVASSLALGVLLFVTCETRNLAMVLLIALPVYEVLRWRRLTLVSVLSVGLCAALLLGQRLIVDTTGPSLFRLEPVWFLQNTLNYVKFARTFWLNGFSNAFSYLVYGVSCLLTGWGVYKYGRRTAGLFDIYALLTVGLIVAYSVTNYRYLLPAFPLYLAYMLLGLRNLAAGMHPVAAKTAYAAAALATVVTFAGAYSRYDWSEIREGIGDPEFMQVADFIKESVPPGDLVVFLKPRLLALETGHPGTTYPNHATAEQLEQYLRNAHARYVVDTNLTAPGFEPDHEVMTPYLERPGAPVERIYANPHYAVYRLAGW